jgi:hypothetical protein
MKRFLIGCLILAGCNSGYTVEREVKTAQVSPAVTKDTEYWVCKRQRPWFMWDSTLRVCDNKEECNAYCETENEK